MFALLEHMSCDETHWDFLVETKPDGLLSTWRLCSNPIETSGPILVEAIGDHRRIYLEFEGEISGGRGVVRRLDRGFANVLVSSPGVWVIRLHGGHLAGMVEIDRGPGPNYWRYRPEMVPPV